MSKRIFEKEYDDEPLYDLDRDIAEAFTDNLQYEKLPKDENEFKTGKFVVTIVWEES